MKEIKHKHHIIPKHMGGSNEIDNLIELTIEEHAEAHKILYEKYNKIEDKIAWKCLSGKSNEVEHLRIELCKIGYKIFLNNFKKKLEWSNKISNTLKEWHRNLTPEKKKLLYSKISISLCRFYRENPDFCKYKKRPSKEFLQGNYEKVRQKLIDGRKNSKKWKESVTNEECRYKKHLQFKDRVFTPEWKKKISEAKLDKPLYNAKEVTINGIKYISCKSASRKLNISVNVIRYRLKRYGNNLII